MTTEWSATDQQWAAVTRQEVWGDYPQNVHAAAIDVNLFTIDENGEKAKRLAVIGPPPWWAPYCGSALYQYKHLAETFDAVVEPMVRKDKAEVFVNVCQPRCRCKRLFCLCLELDFAAAERTVYPPHPAGFFKSMVQPTRPAVKAPAGETIGAVMMSSQGSQSAGRLATGSFLTPILIASRVYLCALPGRNQWCNLAFATAGRWSAIGASLCPMSERRVVPVLGSVLLIVRTRWSHHVDWCRPPQTVSCHH